jgi:predicted DNA-binding protein (MmcQ/YjbR family)
MTARKQLRAHALKHPEAWEDEPWPGDHVAKVGKKIFAFLGGEETVAATALPKRRPAAAPKSKR